MSTAAVRNILRISIGRILPRLKKRIIEEGKKKLEEYKDQLLTHQEIIQSLKSDINSDTCNSEGKDKLHEIAEKLKETLTNIQDIVIKGRDRIQEIEDKLAPLSEKLETPIPGPDPIGRINKIVDAIDPILSILQKIIIVAPGILGAQVAPVINGAVVWNTGSGLDLAKAKIEEYVNLFKSIPGVLNQYRRQADQLVNKITVIKDNIQGVIDKIEELKLLIIYLETKFESDCNKFFDEPNPPASEPSIEPPPLTVEEITLQFETLYGELLDNLILQGDQIAIRRVFILGEDFQKVKNKAGDVKYTSIKKINP
tara:strand:- start:334 stop:1269 length:936 start_codon:yes stop_codon:yes gene_type:complete